MNARVKMICLVGLVFAVFGLWIYSQNVWAQAGTSPVSIAFCNPTKAIRGYQKFMVMNDRLIAEKNRIQKQVIETQKALRAGADELAASGLLPDSQEYKRMRKELLKKTIQNEAFAKFSETDLRLQEQQMKEVCFRDLVSAVGKTAKQKGLVLVVGQALYADEALDITAEVTEQLNLDYKLRG
ncbi:MAG: OmpH family outer membrane protein [Phycisphaerae bacterium]|nr:OmpH family outer membrane protein [Phycisphaerae bacterium]